MTDTFIVGITGGSGSGKTTFAKELHRKLEKDSSLILLDNYYLPLEKQPLDPEGKPNFDLPESLDLKRYWGDLIKLKKGFLVEIDEYTFNNPALKSKKIKIFPKRIIITEGIFIFHQLNPTDLFDIKIFIDVREDLKLARRLKRDTAERGYKEDQIIYNHLHHVTPSYYQYIEKEKENCDIIIPNNKSYNLGFEVVLKYLKSKV